MSNYQVASMKMSCKKKTLLQGKKYLYRSLLKRKKVAFTRRPLPVFEKALLLEQKAEQCA